MSLFTNLTDVNTNAEVSASWRDTNGDEIPDEIGTLNLTDGATYSGSIELLNELESPPEDITEEVMEEADEHQFFYTPQGGIAGRVAVVITDTDVNNLPVGLNFNVTVTSGGAAQGELNVVLSHYDDEPKNGTDRSDETDIDIDIPVMIQ